MALSADRVTRSKIGETASYPVAASSKIYCGSIVAVSATGYALPATANAAYKVVGIARQQADNSGGSDGDINVEVDRGGSYELANSTGHAVTQADAGRVCYVEDDQTVADEGGGAALLAGVVDSIDPVTSQIWVKVGGAAVVDVEADETSAIETVTSGAISVATRTSLISVTGTQAFTLADGTFEGQRKTLVCTVAATTPAGTITPAHYANGTNFHMSAVGEMVELEWHSSGGWRLVERHLGMRGAETVTSGALSLFTETSFISVTGTQAYTLADGLYVGQKKYCRCTVAASTPDGTLTPANPTGFSTADFDAVEEAYGFSWNGAGWECFYVIGGALS